jgi:hypothetical protein
MLFAGTPVCDECCERLGYVEPGEPVGRKDA